MGIRERKKAETRRALVDAASELFAERGVQATTMDDIAQAAGMSRTSVFNYFGHKEMILCEIGARYVNEIATPLRSSEPTDPGQAFSAVTDALAELASRQPALISAVARETTHPDQERRRCARDLVASFAFRDIECRIRDDDDLFGRVGVLGELRHADAQRDPAPRKLSALDARPDAFGDLQRA